MIAKQDDLATIASFQTPENMLLFAEALLRHPDNAFTAAKSVFPRNMAYALYASQNWQHNEDVLSHQKQLLKTNGQDRYLPSKSDVAREIHTVAGDAQEPEVKLKALQLYCNVRGFIEKPGTTIHNNSVCNKIMVVKDHGTDEDWERKLQEQQQVLIESSG